MGFDFKFPDVAEGIIEGKLVDWKIKEGQAIEQDQVLCEMETDKSVLEIPSPKKGVVEKLHFKSGDVVKVGQVLVTLNIDGGGAPAEKQTPAISIAQEPIKVAVTQHAELHPDVIASALLLPKDRQLAQKLGVDVTKIKGSGPGGRITEADIKAVAAGAPVAVAQIAPVGVAAPASHVSVQPSLDAAGRVRATPAVRKLARELGIDIETVVSSSSDGRISEEDVHRAVTGEEIKNAPKHAPDVALVQSIDEKKPTSVQVGEGDTRQKIEGIRAIIKRRMEDSWRHIPHAAVAVDVDIGNLVAEREKDKELLKQRGINLTYLAFIIKVTAAALEKFPQFNASIDDSSNELVLKKHVNVGFATDTDHGLVVPNIKDCNHKSITDIAAAIQDLALRAREKKLRPDEITGGTFSITNVGSFGATGGICIINYPEIAILMVSHMQDRLELVDGKPVIRKILPLTLTFDHRVVDGADAGRFLKFMAEHLSNPSVMLLDVI